MLISTRMETKSLLGNPENANDYVYVAALKHLAQWKDDPETFLMVKNLTHDASDYAYCAAVKALACGWKDNPEILELLRDRAQNDPDKEVRELAEQELAELDKRVSQG